MLHKAERAEICGRGVLVARLRRPITAIERTCKQTSTSPEVMYWIRVFILFVGFLAEIGSQAPVLIISITSGHYRLSIGLDYIWE